MKLLSIATFGAIASWAFAMPADQAVQQMNAAAAKAASLIEGENIIEEDPLKHGDTTSSGPTTTGGGGTGGGPTTGGGGGGGGSGVSDAIVKAANSYIGTSTTAGPDGGVNACAWAVNQVVQNAGYRPVGANPNSVSSVVQDPRLTQVDCSSAPAGALVASCEDDHIGICMTSGCSQIYSNSSYRLCFCWKSGFNFDNYFNCGQAACYVLNS